MPYLLMTNGHVYEIADTYASVKTKLISGSEGEFTVKGTLMFFRYEHIIAMAQNYDQISIFAAPTAA